LTIFATPLASALLLILVRFVKTRQGKRQGKRLIGSVMNNLKCKLGFHAYRRQRIKIVGKKAVYRPYMGVREVWCMEMVCSRCGEWNLRAFPRNELGAYISGGYKK
jgi:hypothetical protein